MNTENGGFPIRNMLGGNHDSLHAVLSPREAIVASLVCEGHSNKIIANKLDVSHHTVASYLRRIYAKLDVSNKAMLTAAVMRHEHVLRANMASFDAGGAGKMPDSLEPFPICEEVAVK
jgi:DNA-binding CsgD family transcriptional regulator